MEGVLILGGVLAQGLVPEEDLGADDACCRLQQRPFEASGPPESSPRSLYRFPQITQPDSVSRVSRHLRDHLGSKCQSVNQSICHFQYVAGCVQGAAGQMLLDACKRTLRAGTVPWTCL